MKTTATMFRIALTVLFVISIYTEVSAQRPNPYSRLKYPERKKPGKTLQQKKKKTVFGIRGVGVHAEYYQPSLSYLNKTYLVNENWKEKIEGGLSYGIFADVNINRSLQIRSGVSYWKQMLESGTLQYGYLMQNQTISLSLTSAQMDVAIQPPFRFPISPYFGGVAGLFGFRIV